VTPQQHTRKHRRSADVPEPAGTRMAVLTSWWDSTRMPGAEEGRFRDRDGAGAVAPVFTVIARWFSDGRASCGPNSDTSTGIR
jgi:hypothetical protein